MENMAEKDFKAQRDDELALLRQSLFNGRPYYEKCELNARLHLTRERWDFYGWGYKRAADILVDWVAQEKMDQDMLVYSIAFLYRHYIELRLKELLIVGAKLLDQTPDVPYTHNLLVLWRRVRKVVEQAWPESEKKHYLDALEERLKEFCAVDPGSYAFRYPEDKTGRQTLGSITYLNLYQLKKVMTGVSQLLEGFSDGLWSYFDYKYEMLADYFQNADY